jgi:predicted SprT family Zn-dependent metalloprotease
MEELELEEYANKVAEKMGFKDLCVKVKPNSKLKSDGRLYIKPNSVRRMILREIKELLNKSLEDNVYFAIGKELESKTESFLEKNKKWWKYLPPEIKIEINQNIKNVKTQKDIIDHELGHYYTFINHSKINRILEVLSTPERLLRMIAYPLPEVVTGVTAVLAALTSEASATGRLSPFLPLVFSSIALYFSSSYLARELLANYYGRKYKV